MTVAYKFKAQKMEKTLNSEAEVDPLQETKNENKK